jgi:hypothetical protein
MNNWGSNIVSERNLFNFVANNPFHLLGVPSNSSRKDILKTQERFLKMAKIGTFSKNSEFTINCYTPVRDIESLQKAVQQISKIDYRLFWFIDSKHISEINNKSVKMLSNTNIENYDEFLAMIYSQFCNFERIDLSYWELILKYVADFRFNYPCFEDLQYFEKRFQSIENDGIPIYGRSIYDRLNEIIDLPITVFISQIIDKDLLIKFIDIIERLNRTTLLNNISTSIYDQFSTLVQKDIEEFSNSLAKYKINDYEFSDKDLSNLSVIFEKYQTIIKGSIDFVSKLKGFPAYTLEKMKTDFLTNHVDILRKANNQSKYKIFSKIMTFLGKQTTIPLVKDLTYLNKEYAILKKGEVKVETDRKHGYLRKDDLAIVDNRDDVVLFIAYKAYGDDPTSQRILGNLYSSKELEIRNRFKVPYNVNIAFEWWMKAAKQNDSDAQFSVSLAYINGSGVYQDRRESIYWLKKAASNGNEEAYKIILEYKLY